MGRQRKLTKWSIENALRRCGSISESARQEDVDRRTFQRSMKREGVDKDAVLRRIATPGRSGAAPGFTDGHLPPTEQEIKDLQAFLESHGWKEHACSGNDTCAYCREFLAEYKRKMSEQQGKPAVLNTGPFPVPACLAPRPKDSKLAMSYAPPKRAGDR